MTGAPASVDAGAVSRLLAYLVDLAVLSAALAGASAVAAYLVAVISGVELDVQGDRGLAAAASVGWWIAYFAGSWALTGRTPGMALLGLAVVRPDLTRTPASSALVRAITLPLSVALLGLGFLGILVHPRRRALHDLLAGTVVVYSPPRTAPPALTR